MSSDPKGDGFPPVVGCGGCNEKKICHPCAECGNLLCWSCLDSSKERSCMDCEKYFCSSCYRVRKEYGRCSECQQGANEAMTWDEANATENGPYFAYDADEWTEKTMDEDD